MISDRLCCNAQAAREAEWIPVTSTGMTEDALRFSALCRACRTGLIGSRSTVLTRLQPPCWLRLSVTVSFCVSNAHSPISSASVNSSRPNITRPMSWAFSSRKWVVICASEIAVILIGSTKPELLGPIWKANSSVSPMPKSLPGCAKPAWTCWLAHLKRGRQ